MARKEYQPLVQLLQFECHYCGKVEIINPNKLEDVKKTANMLKVQTADGVSYQYCDTECARPDLKFFKGNPLEVAPDHSGFVHADSGIVLTDAVEKVFDGGLHII